MAHPNEDLLRRGYEAFGKGDMATIAELFADDVVWHVPGNNPLSGDHEGRDSVLAFFGKSAELSGGTLKLEVHDILANDEHGVALTRGSAQRGGKSLDNNGVQVVHIRDGKVVESWLYAGDQAASDEFWS
ncbi:MAG: nuclear transport factor 2 family protein [Actinobacteria bacterium]|nr:nuclear transport factor 2 family protein [Actinomycetota bacterium]